MPEIENWRADSSYTDLPDTFELHAQTISGADINQWSETITAPDSGSGVVGSGVAVAPYAPSSIEWPKIEFGVCYVCGTVEDGITVVCGLCKDAIQTMREYMLERIKREIAEFAEE